MDEYSKENEDGDTRTSGRDPHVWLYDTDQMEGWLPAGFKPAGLEKPNCGTAPQPNTNAGTAPTSFQGSVSRPDAEMGNVYWAAMKGFASGLGTGMKAMSNGLVKATKSAATLGPYEHYDGLVDYTAADIANGAYLSEGLANASGSILIGVASGNVGCVGGNIGKAVKMYDLAGNAVETSRGVADMMSNGVSFSNVLQVAGGAGGLAGNMASKCFTEGTQIVVGIEYYDENTCGWISAGVEYLDGEGGGTETAWRYVTKNIEDIETGDLVYSYDTITGETTRREVTDVFVRESDHINYLSIVDEQGREQVLETTDGHPFWVVTNNPDLSRAANDYSDGLYHGNLEVTANGYWVEAKDLNEGDIFLGANGELSTLVQAERVQFDETIKVYNFAVDGNHDYFVIAQVDEYGQTCILVHNAKYPPDYPGNNQKNISAQFANEREARNYAFQRLGKKPVDIGDNKIRSVDGKYQFRAKPADLGDPKGPHVHLETLNPKTGEVLKNMHLNFPLIPKIK